jgi:glycosyltransferase involved in cell wall biosynthesis
MSPTRRPHDIASLSVVRSHARIRVLQIIGNGIVGGMESVVERLVEGLPRERFELSALVPFEGPFADRLRALDVDCHALPMPDNPSWSSIQNGCALVQAQGIDVIHAHLTNAHLLAALIGRLSGRPVLATIHGRQLGIADLEAHRLADTHLCTVCRASELHALGLGVDAARLACIPNGVDVERFRPEPGARIGALRRSLFGDDGAALEAPLVGFVGRLSPEKGPEVFVRAALMLRERLPAARFVIVGDGPLRESVQALVAQYRLEGRLHLAGLRGDMPGIYRELDVVVSSSHSEAMPLAIMEALASGVPVVATRVGGVPDLVEQGGCGWLCEPGHFDAIAARVATLVEQPAERERMARRARERMVQRFDVRRQVEATAQLLATLAGQSPRTAPAAAPAGSAAGFGPGV